MSDLCFLEEISKVCDNVNSFKMKCVNLISSQSLKRQTAEETLTNAGKGYISKALSKVTQRAFTH